MAIKPILFNTEMVRAILDGRKTCTRRIVKPQQLIGMLPDKCKNGAPEEFLKEKKLMFKPYCDMTDIELINTAYKAPYQPGDIMYVRETWQYLYELDEMNRSLRIRGNIIMRQLIQSRSRHMLMKMEWNTIMRRGDHQSTCRKRQHVSGLRLRM